MSYVDDFISRYWNDALRASQKTGINPDLILGQAALESNWGRSTPGNNLFGIKGSGTSQSTLEYINGQWVRVTDSFRKYSNPSASFDGWADFINGNKRYAGVNDVGGTADQIARLANAGYATDPKYSDKLQGIMGTIQRSGAMIDGDPIKAVLSKTLGDRFQDFQNGSFVKALTSPIGTAIDAVTPDWDGWFKRGAMLVFALIFIAAALFAFKGGDAVSIISKAGGTFK